MSDPVNIRGQCTDVVRRLSSLTENDALWTERDKFLAEQDAEEQRDRARTKAEAKVRRLAMIPKCYREPFDPSKSNLPDKTLQSIAKWTECARIGIGLSGTTGQGKTRALCSILMRLNCPWLYLPAWRFSELVEDQWSDNYRVASEAESLVKEAQRVKVLMLDDVGDEKHTEASSHAVKALIERRTANGLHILWTSNLTPDQITAKHGERGAAIARRLAEFTWIPSA